MRELELAAEYVTQRILGDLDEERTRQERLREQGKFTHSCATPGITDSTCTRVLQEEVDEVLDDADNLRRTMSAITRTMNDHAMNDANIEMEGSRGKLRKELIEVMAVACAWVERIDGKKELGHSE